MSVFSYVLGVLLLVWILFRQMAVRPAPRVLRIQIPAVIGVIGIFELISYSNAHHHIDPSAWLWVVATLVIGAVGFGILRGLTVHVWTTDHWVLRQGTSVTMVLWIVSLAVHLGGDVLASHVEEGGGLVAASFLLYLGLTLGVQNAVVHRRAQPLWERLGPRAGSPLRVDISQGPGAFFATFRTGPGPGPGEYHDPNVIDADVVEDDDEPPPELPAGH